MCFYTKVVSKAKEIEKELGYPVSELTDYAMGNQINGFANPYLPVINGEMKAQAFQWGLLPHWAKDKSFQKKTLNARIETISEKPSYRAYINNRCLVVVNGFYEWKHVGKEKQKHLISLKNEKVFCLAGIYSVWQDQPTFSIVTTKANELMANIHNTKKRMPVVIPKNLHRDWITNPKIEEFSALDVDLEAINLDKSNTLFDE